MISFILLFFLIVVYSRLSNINIYCKSIILFVCLILKPDIYCKSIILFVCLILKPEIIPKELRETVSSPSYNVKHLHLYRSSSSSSLFYTRHEINEIMDSLLWISPLLDILTIECSCKGFPDFYKITFTVFLFLRILKPATYIFIGEG